ncbi:protein of unassigned function [Methylobacterium oryzae CBMB20]|uniref:Protein of unassigned function n=1 Tax=Methylobacterium oryzae CBMB20 TaxID=693986 RepID=A0A089NTJ3_9HYPH|nr:protein of unassigned function [Methylobacterium oryzae CBMB20]
MRIVRRQGRARPRVPAVARGVLTGGFGRLPDADARGIPTKRPLGPGQRRRTGLRDPS